MNCCEASDAGRNQTRDFKRSLHVGISASAPRALTALLTIVLLAHPALAVIDITGNWDLDVTVTYGNLPPIVQLPNKVQIVQTGTSITIGSPPLYRGTIDPDTGALRFSGTTCTGLFYTAPDTFTGAAALDSNSFTVTGTVHGRTTPTMCAPYPTTVVASRASCLNRALDSGAPQPLTLGHYRCYRGTDLKAPPFAKITVDTADEVTAEMVDVLKLKYVCVPVDSNNDGTCDPAPFLGCYQVLGDLLEPRPSIAVSAQFQTSRFEQKKGKLLCVPGVMTVTP